MKNNLIIRTISGVVLVAIIVFAVYLNTYSRYIILSIIALGGVWEFLTLLSKQGIKVERTFAVCAAFLMMLFAFLGYEVMLLLSGLFIVRAIAELYFKHEKPMESIAYEALALIYIAVPMMFFSSFQREIVLFLFILVWSNDVGAYLVGSMIGKRKLFERISPKKSWEGFFGGLIFTVVIALCLNKFSFITGSVLSTIIISLLISIASVYGDLFESMIKRSLKIKDSGSIIPGHGGFLDRFDALYFAIPIYYIAVVIIRTFSY